MEIFEVNKTKLQNLKGKPDGYLMEYNELIGEKELELIKTITSDDYRKLCEERYPELKHFSY